MENETNCKLDRNLENKNNSDSLQVTHIASQITRINYWRNCAEGV